VTQANIHQPKTYAEPEEKEPEIPETESTSTEVEQQALPAVIPATRIDVIISNLLILFATLFSVPENEIQAWVVNTRRSLVRIADQVNVLRVWVSAIIGSIFRVMSICVWS
jgi:hypothetical protein